MKLTIELDPTADRALFDRVMAAVTDHPAPVTMSNDTAPDEKSEENTSKGEPEKAPEEMSQGPRVYGDPGPGRKRRSKEEKAEDDEIDALAGETNIAISYDIPASELLEQMRQAKAEASDEKSDDDEGGFEMEDEKPAKEMSAEEFRAAAITLNKKKGKAAIAVLSEYANGLSKIKPKDYAEVLERLEALDDA